MSSSNPIPTNRAAIRDPSGVRAARQAVGYAAAVLALSLLPAAFGVASPAYLAGALLLGVPFVALSMALLKVRNDRSAWRLFLGSVTYLPLLLVLMVVDKAVSGL